MSRYSADPSLRAGTDAAAAAAAAATAAGGRGLGLYGLL